MKNYEKEAKKRRSPEESSRLGVPPRNAPLLDQKSKVENMLQKSTVIFVCLFLLVLSPCLWSQPTPVDFSAWSDAQKESFLLRAKVVKTERVSTGVTGTLRATLCDGQSTHDASLQSIDVSKRSVTTRQGTELNFRDSYKYNIAAYRLDRLLNLHMVPVSVERKIRGKKASLTWWVDDVEMMDKKRYQRKIAPPNRARWNDQKFQVRIFNELVYNTDPNRGNLLITKDWKLVMIDFSRGFRRHKELKKVHPVNGEVPPVKGRPWKLPHYANRGKTSSSGGELASARSCFSTVRTALGKLRITGLLARFDVARSFPQFPRPLLLQPTIWTSERGADRKVPTTSPPPHLPDDP